MPGLFRPGLVVTSSISLFRVSKRAGFVTKLIPSEVSEAKKDPEQ